MTEIQTLLHAIAALEAQRSSLGDDVVNAALAPMRQKLALLQGQAQLAENQRKQITVLFANITGLVAPSENLDIEESRDMIQDVWRRLDPIIISHGGAIDKHIGDTVMGLWGTSVVREDDPERAIKAALAMQAALTAFCKERHLGLSIRIGLNTGPVLLGEVGSTHEFTAMGDTVNLASRLESAAPVDGILIAHNTYRHVSGMFDVQVQPPLTVKGKAEPVQTYLVLRAKQRQFWVATRGVEGIQTHMIGRDVELAYLQSTLGTVAEQRKLQMVTLVAEAGLGKSRLLREFDTWLETYQKSCVVIRGRASQEMQSVPYALLRDIFSFRFQIQDRDPLKTVQEKMETGIGARASVSGAAWPASESPMRAHIIGHWIGFDLSESPYLTEILEDAQQIRDRALIYLVDYFKSLTESSTIVILLEDIHWADDSSLDVFEHLGHMLSRHPVLIITAARPSLFDRRPSWASGQPVQNRLNLSPLPEQDSQRLVDDILQKVESIPPMLRSLMINNAEGNPFYMEELLKMLIEDGVVTKGIEHWQVNPDRLAVVRVPSTLTAVLQARFDLLTALEKNTLQCASVFGRTFWEKAVDFIAKGAARLDTERSLSALCSREMIFQSDTPTFAAMAEYIFQHTLLRSTVYESILKRDRPAYHARAADWLISHSAERESEFIGQIAEHFERAGKAEKAVKYLARAAVGALRTYAYRESADYFSRALNLLPSGNRDRIPLLVQFGEALWYLGSYEQAQNLLHEGLSLGKAHGEEGWCADALIHLAGIARKQGNWPQAQTFLNESLEIARRLGDQSRIAHALHTLGWLNIRQGAYAEARAFLLESRAIYAALGDRHGLADSLNGLGTVALNLGEYEQTRQLYQESLALFHAVSDRPGESAALVNLGEAARRQGDYAAARQYYEMALKIDHEMGDELLAAITLGNLGHTALACHDYPMAEAYYRKGLQTAAAINDIPDILDILSGLSGVLTHTNRSEQALMVLSVVLNHPGLEDESRTIAEQALADLQHTQPQAVHAAGLQAGREYNLEEVVTEILASFE